MATYLSPKEVEAILWGIAQMSDYPHRSLQGPTDPLYILVQEGYGQQDIVAACYALEDLISDHPSGMAALPDPLDGIEAAILRQCVETTTWLEAYLTPPINEAGRVEAHSALVSLAAKLDGVGVPINIIPDL